MQMPLQVKGKGEGTGVALELRELRSLCPLPDADSAVNVGALPVPCCAANIGRTIIYVLQTTLSTTVGAKPGPRV